MLIENKIEFYTASRHVIMHVTKWWCEGETHKTFHFLFPLVKTSTSAIKETVLLRIWKYIKNILTDLLLVIIISFFISIKIFIQYYHVSQNDASFTTTKKGMEFLGNFLYIFNV